ncbi:MAG: response regulator [Holophagales bacterium]|nr:response regulator [Holophagales bacterium]
MTRILVVDDEAQNRYLLEVLFTSEGLEVEWASNGREALVAARRRSPDLVISDILMPEMDGFLLCREMKADAALRRIPFVFYTATYTDAEDERVALEAGGDLFLRKPAEPDVLLAEVRRLLGAGEAGERIDRESDLAAEVAFLRQHDRVQAKKLDKRHHELQESEDRYRSYFRGSPVSILVAEEDGRLVDVNPAACRLSGYAAAELLGANLSLLLGEGGPDEPLRLVAEPGLEAGRSSSWTLRRKDGVRRNVALTAIRLDDDRILAFCEDVTERSRAEEAMQRANADLEKRVLERTEQLERANRELEAFTTSVSHDLREPLVALEGYSRLLEQGSADRLDAESRQNIDGIRRNARQMSDLVSSLLALSKAGQQELQVGPIDMQRLAGKVVEEVVTEAERRNTDVTLHPLPAAEGDVRLVRQVFAHLVGNALKFSSRKPRRTIEIGSRQVGSDTAWFVRDDGIGFEPGEANRIFGVFERLHHDRAFEGTGIGLALVRRIVERHGGRVWAEGSPGAGATFWFTLGSPGG